MNRTKGALGEFLRAIKAGRVPQGSILLVESLDRLSREDAEDAYDYLRDIVRGGVTVVTLQDGREYSKGNFKLEHMIMSILIMTRANEESLTKSIRSKSAWEDKRMNIGEKKLTRRCPAWLELNEDMKGFTKIPDRCQTVKRIFEMFRSGKGAESIAKILNEEGIGWIPENGWRKSYVVKILRSRAVLGEFQPHTGRGQKRTPSEMQ